MTDNEKRNKALVDGVLELDKVRKTLLDQGVLVTIDSLVLLHTDYTLQYISGRLDELVSHTEDLANGEINAALVGLRSTISSGICAIYERM